MSDSLSFLHFKRYFGPRLFFKVYVPKGQILVEFTRESLKADFFGKRITRHSVTSCLSIFDEVNRASYKPNFDKSRLHDARLTSSKMVKI